jgi:imidazoleglycerol-phosphate dehydratase
MIQVERNTKETKVEVRLGAAAGDVKVDTGLPFFDHMLNTFGRYLGRELTIRARGDLRHHLIEDVAITVGTAVRRAIPDTAVRYGERTLAMDDALVQAVVDVAGRFYYRGKLPSRLYTHWMRSFCEHAKITAHLRLIRGKDRHHLLEASFKALGLALRQALVDEGVVFSTKGSVSLEVK